MTLPATNLEGVPQMTAAQAKACKDIGGNGARNADLTPEQERELSAVIAAACEVLRERKDAITAACEWPTGYCPPEIRGGIRRYCVSSRCGEKTYHAK